MFRACALIVLMFTSAAPAGAATCRVTDVLASSITCGTTIGVGTASAADQAALAKIKPGTLLVTPDPGTAAGNIQIATASVSPGRMVVAAMAGVAAAVLFGVLVTGGPVLALVVGADGRCSNSKMQAAGWMGVLFVSYVGTFGLRLWSGMHWMEATNVGISSNLLTLASVSAVAAGGAKIATGTKVANAAAAGGRVVKARVGRASLWDLFHNDHGHRDIGDAQMILVAAASIGLFIFNVVAMWRQLPLAAHVDLPEPTNTLTFAFGGSMGAYLAKKIGGTVEGS